jgi:hypothetical protein
MIEKMADASAQLGRWLVVFGLTLIVVGGLLMLGGKFPWLRIGRLPGDFTWGSGSVRVYVPLMTSLLLSLLLTLIFWLFRR